MSGIFHDRRWYENTDMICRRCGSPVYESDNRSTAISASIAMRICIPLRLRNRTRFIYRLSWWPAQWMGSH